MPSDPPDPPPPDGQSGTRPALLEGEALVTHDIPVVGPSGGSWNAFRRIIAYDVRPGELFDFRATYKLVNNTGFNVEFAPTIVRIPAPAVPPSVHTDPGFGFLDAHYVRDPVGDNVTPGDHYVKDSFSAIWEADAAYEYIVFFMAGQARSTSATGNEYLVNQHWQMRFQCLRYP